MKWKVLDHKKIQVPRSQKLGITIKDKGGQLKESGGYEYTLSTNSKQYSLRIAATKSFSSTIKTEKDYEKLCSKVVELTESRDVYERIRKPWEENDNTCFVIVTKKEIIYTGNWNDTRKWHREITQKLFEVDTKTIL